jgi:hypothetical protein
MNNPLPLPRWAPVLCVASLTIAGTAVLGNDFLAAPVGAFIYFPAAVMLNILGFSLALWLLLARRGNSALVASGVLGVIALTASSVIGVPFATFTIIDKLYHSDPIGVSDDVALGPCKTRSVSATKNQNGLIADVRETYCSGNWDGDLMYFVFVHEPGGRDTKQTLVFRYRADTLPSTKPPTAVWSSNRLAIAAHSNITDVTYQMLDTKDISIQYDLRSDSRPMFPALSESVVRQ